MATADTLVCSGDHARGAEVVCCQIACAAATRLLIAVLGNHVSGDVVNKYRGARRWTTNDFLNSPSIAIINVSCAAAGRAAVGRREAIVAIELIVGGERRRRTAGMRRIALQIAREIVTITGSRDAVVGGPDHRIGARLVLRSDLRQGGIGRLESSVPKAIVAEGPISWSRAKLDP